MCKSRLAVSWNTLLVAAAVLCLPSYSQEGGGGGGGAAYLFGAAKIIEATQPIGKTAADAAADVGIAAAQAAGTIGKMQADAGAQIYKSRMNLEMQKNNLETAKEIAKINWENTLKREQMEREERLRKFYADLRMAKMKDERDTRNRFYVSMINYSQAAAQMEKDNMLLRMGILGLLGQNSFNLQNGGMPQGLANPFIGMDQSNVPNGGSQPPANPMFGLRASGQLLSNLNTRVRGIGIPRPNPKIIRDPIVASLPALERTVPNTSSFPYRTVASRDNSIPRAFTSHGGSEDY